VPVFIVEVYGYCLRAEQLHMVDYGVMFEVSSLVRVGRELP
jgi:hypothetical protein